MNRTPRAGVRLAALLAATSAASLAPAPAVAHSSFAGLNDFYSGVLHPVVVPAHALAIVCAGLFVGQRKLGARLNRALVAFGGAVTVGALAAALHGAELTTTAIDTVLLGVTAGLGLLVALDRRLPLPPILVVLGATGAVVGLGSASDANALLLRLASAAGTLLGALFILLWGVALNGFFVGKPWQPIAVRVLGSWMAAAAMLAFALALVADEIK